jgi:hypothetical protein
LLLAFVVTDTQAWGKHKQATAPPTPVAPPVVLPPPPPPPPQSIFSGDPAAPPQIAQTDMLQTASSEVQNVARWVGSSRDNAGLPFLLVDKADAQVYLFDPAGHLLATAPVLLGMSRGDRLLAPNTATMAQMPQQVRITPAGRYVSRLAIDSHGKELLVIDYDASISLHPVIKGTPLEHRAERLASATSQDNRISYGCINVPPAFYAMFVHSAFNQTKGIVYILPETSPAGQLFGFSETPGAQQSATALNAPAAQTVPDLSWTQQSATELNDGAGQTVASPSGAQQSATTLNARAAQTVTAPGAK